MKSRPQHKLEYWPEKKLWYCKHCVFEGKAPPFSRYCSRPANRPLIARRRLLPPPSSLLTRTRG